MKLLGLDYMANMENKKQTETEMKSGRRWSFILH